MAALVSVAKCQNSTIDRLHAIVVSGNPKILGVGMSENPKALQKEEEASFDAEDKDQPIPPVSVVAYNEQRACADLNRMFVSGRLELQPDFQREVVWRDDERARFIDSIVKNLPIPSMCFSLDAKSQKWKVIDGLQRMSSIVAFLGDKPWRMPNVEDVHLLLRGRTNLELRAGTDDEKRLFAAVEDVTIPVTVIRCDYEIDAHMRYLFMIFNRLNSGGVRLNNQEIRNCIFSGPFNSMLKQFDSKNKGKATNLGSYGSIQIDRSAASYNRLF